MKTAEAKPASVATSQKANRPFFSKESEGNFFGESVNDEPSFFKPASAYSVNGKGVLQTKLTIGQPNDIYEKEADAMADKVVQRLSEPGVQRKSFSSNETITPFVQKKCAHCEEEEKKKKEDKPADKQIRRKPIFESNAEQLRDDKAIQRKCAACEKEEKVQKKSDTSAETTSPNIESKLNSSKGSGSPLPADTRSQMESSFGTDFSSVRIHTNGSAVQMNKDLHAQAFTHGSDIYFNSGKYDANSNSGKHLLAHELTHTVQQGSQIHKKEVPQIQHSWLGDAWDSATGAVSDAASAVGGAISDAAGWVGDKITGVASGIADGASAAWNAATTFLGSAASAIWSGLSSLGSDVLNWLAAASSSVWKAIQWFGAKAWEGIKILGSFLWEKLSMLGANVWSFISNIPIRLWRIVVHGWEGITGALRWVWDGLSGAAGHLWQGLVGVFGWLGEGIMGAVNWIKEGVVAGLNWAVDFISDPSLSKLWDGLTGSLSWAWSGLKGFARWGWNGIVGAAIWAWKGIKGFASWIWDGIIGGLEWAGRLLLYVLDLIGFLEALEILWGLIFRMRKLTQAEIDASLEVHPAGMIPYNLVRVDEGSLVAFISGYFSGGGYRAVTTAHVLHVAPHEDIGTMVHELTHVAQYEHTGSVYMAEAIHAQAFGGGYNYINANGTFKHKHFKEFNREQQAQICEDYYKSLHGLGGAASASALLSLINEMRLGKF